MEEVVIKVYKRRWLILFIFSINSLANAMLFTSITSINDIICRYYQISPGLTDWAANSFTLIAVLIALPSAYCMDSFGLRTLVLIGSSLNAICVCLHLAGSQRNGIIFVLVGQFVAGFSVGAILQVPVRLSTVWFPEHEHAKATTIAMIFNSLGLGIGFLQPSYMVPNSDDMEEIYNGIYLMNITHVVFLGVCLLLVYVFFDEKPPLPPSYAKALTDFQQADEHVDVPGFKKSLLLLFSDWNFIKLSIPYGLYFGLFNFFVTCLNEMAEHIVSSKEIGWLGFFSNLVAILGMFILSSMVDRFRIYKSISLLLSFGTIISWAAFSCALLHWKSTVTLYVTYLLLNLFGVPFFVIGIEYVSEITYPIPEGLSSAIILMFGNCAGLVTVMLFGELVDNGHLSLVCYTILGLYSIIFLFLCFVKADLKRSDTELQHEENLVVNSGVSIKS